MASLADDVEGRLDGRLSAGSVNDGVGTLAEVSSGDDVLGVLLGGNALREVGVGGGERLGKVKLGLDDVDRDDLGGAVGLGDGGAEQADGAGTHDDNGLAGLDLGLLGDVHGDGEGLDEGALLEGDGLGELVAEVGGGGPEAGQGAVIGGSGGELHVRAEVVVARKALDAAAAGVAGLESDAVADGEGLDGVADGNDGAGRLVAEDHGVLHDEVADGAVEPVVDIGTADAGVVDGDEDVMGVLDLGDGLVLEADVEGLVENEGEVLERGGRRSVLAWGGSIGENNLRTCRRWPF